jgi:hypothetical protein
MVKRDRPSKGMIAMKTARLMTTSLALFALGVVGPACSSDSGGATGGGGSGAGSSGAAGNAASSGAAGAAASSGGGGAAAGSGIGGAAAGTGTGTGGAAAGTGTGGAGGSGASTGAGGGVVYLDAGEETCGASTAEADVKLVNVLLVIDKSGSMAEVPAGFATDKWTAMKTALAAALGPVKGVISFGLEMFPFDPTMRIPILSCGAACCAMPTGAAAINIPVEPGTAALPKILGAVASQDPGGATPMAAALKEALAYYTTGAGFQLQGGKYVVLATDGAPNCNAAATCGTGVQCLDDSATTTQIAALKIAGVSTFVIGIPGSESYSTVLDAFADAGGQPASATSPKYFAVSASGGTAALTDAFKAIATKLVTACDLKLKSDPPDPTLLNVRIDGAFVPKAKGDAGADGGADGWRLDQSTSPPTVNFVGATCDNIKANGAKNVQVLFGCPYIPIN